MVSQCLEGPCLGHHTTDRPGGIVHLFIGQRCLMPGFRRFFQLPHAVEQMTPMVQGLGFQTQQGELRIGGGGDRRL